MLDYLKELESDFLILARVDPMKLDGPLFFRMAVNMGAYDGALTARVLKERRQEQGKKSLSSLLVENPDLIEWRTG